MKFPKKGFNRVRKSLIPDKPVGEGATPKKHYPSIGKTSANDWRRRWFLGVMAMALLSGAPLLAQNATSSGSVQLPPSQVAPALAPTTVAPSPVAASTDSGDIHDIRGPISIPYQWLWIAYVLGSAILIAVLYGLWCRFRQTKAASKSPFEIALERLEAARALMTADSVREYAFTVSEIIRVYIEQRFNEKAARRTTEEFLFDLVQQRSTPLAQHRHRLEDFLGHCDLMKFARWEASVPELESMHDSARVFILDTKPQPELVKSSTPLNIPVQLNFFP